MRIRACFDGVQELHVADIVDVNLILEHHDQALAVEFDREDGRGKSELTDGGLALHPRNKSMGLKGLVR